MDEEGLPLTPEDEEPEPQPPKEEIRIVEMSDDGTAKEKICKECKLSKPVYVEVESQGVIEYICQSCFEVDVSDQGKECRSCEAPLKQDDAFCGKCGEPTERKCSECGTTAKADDAFCGNCGNKL